MFRSMTTDETFAKMEVAIPMKRVAKSEEVAKAVCFYWDEEKSGYVTGANMRVAGGLGPGVWIG